MLRDESNVKIVCGAPGTGKTLLTVFAAADAIKANRSSLNENRKVLYVTMRNMHQPMKYLFYNNNGYDESEIVISPYNENTLKQDYANKFNFVVFDEAKVFVVDKFPQYYDRNIRYFFATSGQLEMDELRNITHSIANVEHAIGQPVYFKELTQTIRGTKHIIEFWQNIYTAILPNYALSCGHSIFGRPVDHRRFLTGSDAIDYFRKELTKMVAIGDDDNHPVVIFDDFRASRLLAVDVLYKQKISFSYSLAYENRSHIMMSSKKRSTITRPFDSASNSLSCEWPIVIAFAMNASANDAMFRMLASSRAVAHLVYIERDTRMLHEMVRTSINDDRVFTSFNAYKKFRENMIDDDDRILKDDLIFGIISQNRFTEQWRMELAPFAHCNSWIQFIEMLTNDDYRKWLIIFMYHSDLFRRLSATFFKHNVYMLSFTSVWLERNCSWITTDHCNSLKAFLSIINELIYPNAMPEIVDTLRKSRIIEMLTKTRCYDLICLLGDAIEETIVCISLVYDRPICLSSSDYRIGKEKRKTKQLLCNVLRIAASFIINNDDDNLDEINSIEMMSDEESVSVIDHDADGHCSAHHVTSQLFSSDFFVQMNLLPLANLRNILFSGET